MPPHNGIHLLPQMMAQQQQPQGPPLVIVGLVDAHLVALVAAQLDAALGPAARVNLAHEIIAESVVRADRLTKLIKAKMEAAAKAAEAE